MTDLLTLGAAWRQAAQRIDRLDARLLLEHVSGCTHADLIAHPERSLSAAQAASFETLVTRRAAGEPFAYLVGEASFYGESFAVSPAVLIPRADTEVLVEQARAHIKARAGQPRVLDLGTGSGIVAITLAKCCPTAQVTAVDLSPDALDVARGNAARLGADVRFLAGDWYAPVCGERFDVIVSNPPYIVAGDPHLSAGGLPFEPAMALTDGIDVGDGGDGLACIRALIDGASAHFDADGWLLIEHGYDQAVQVRALLVAAGFSDVASWCDLADIERVSGGRWMGRAKT